MGLTYFKRYRMEIDLRQGVPFRAPPPEGYRILPWDPSLLDLHAECKFLSFRTEIDANLFPCLGEREGCRRLMRDIARKKTFVPHATWLAVYTGPRERFHEHCGTVQGLRDRTGVGGIQNLGITPEHRGRGVGTSLLWSALDGFRRARLYRVYLEVTADNPGAIELYRRVGFRRTKTVYKAVEVACP